MTGGEGGIRTPDSLTTMPDFESGAFNRALPPLRFAVDPRQTGKNLPVLSIPGLPWMALTACAARWVHVENIPSALKWSSLRRVCQERTSAGSPCPNHGRSTVACRTCHAGNGGAALHQHPQGAHCSSGIGVGKAPTGGRASNPQASCS